MDGHTEKRANKDRSAQRRPGISLKHRALALLLAMVMILASTGLQAFGQTVDSEGSESAVAEQVETLPDDDTSEETPTEDIVEPTEVPTEVPTEGDTVSETEVPEKEEEEPDLVGVPVVISDEGDLDDSSTSVYQNDSEVVTPVASSDTVEDYDISLLITPDSWMKVFIGDKAYTLDYLNENNITVPKGARVDIQLEWDKISGIQKGQNLVYQIPKDLVSNVEEEETFPFADGNGDFAGYMTLDSDGKFTVEIDSDYYDKWSKKQGTGTLELDYLTLEFYATLSETRGEHSGNGDNEFVFKEETAAEPQSKVSFVVPFEYKNEKAVVSVEKTNSFDAVSKTISYTVTVTALDTNTLTADNVVLTDLFTSGASYLTTSGSYGYYQNVTATKNDGTTISIADNFVYVNGSNGGGKLTIGDMEPGESVTLTYTVYLTDSYFTNNTDNTTVVNKATITYNTDATASTTSTASTGGTVQIQKAYSSSIVAEADADGKNTGKHYITYMVKVTAYGDTVTNISVEDQFTGNSTAISSVVVETGSPSTGTATVVDGNQLSWTGITLAAGESATLQYRAYLDTSKWQLESDNKTDAEISATLTIANTAKLYVDGIYYDKASQSLAVKKIWVNKGNVTQDDGKIKYTLDINQGLMTDDVVTIQDGIKAGGTMDYDSNITVYVYKDSSGSQQITGSPFTLTKDDLTSYTSTGWTIDLATVKDGAMKGAYYYKVIYYANTDGSTTEVENGVGVGLKDGTKYSEIKHTKAVKITSEKKLTTLNFTKYKATWTSKMSTAIDVGTTYKDYLIEDNVKTGSMYFTEANINSIKVEWNGETVSSDYYTVSYYNKITFTAGSTLHGTATEGYQGFIITFTKAIACDASNPVTVTYDTYVDKENVYEQVKKKSSNWALGAGLNDGDTGYHMGNYGQWTLGTGLAGDLNSYWFSRKGAKDIIKGGLYDPTTGKLTWKIYVNRFCDMTGKATITDIIPAGLTCESVSVNRGEVGATSYGLTASKKINGGNFVDDVTKNPYTISTVLQDDNTTKLTVTLNNMCGYSYGDSNGTVSQTTGSSGINPNSGYPSWEWYGIVTITIVTRVDDLTLLTLGFTDSTSGTSTVKTASYTNDVSVENDSMAQVEDAKTSSYTATASLDNKQVNLSKAMATYSSGNYVTYNMTVNSSGVDLISDEDTLTIIDVMEDERMSLATNKSDYFVVTNTNTSEDITSQCTMTLVEDYTGEGTKYKITVPDATPIKITYKVRLNAAVDETVTPKNKAYFEYKGTELSQYAVESSNSVKIVKVQGTSGSSAIPYFYIYKQDQYGAAVENAEFSLYTVAMENGKVVFENGEPKLDDLVMSGTTNYEGKCLFMGNQESGSDTSYIYCLVETSAPDGYVITNPRTYLEFYQHENSGLDDVLGLEFEDETVTITNDYVPAQLAVSFTKTLNSQTLASDTDFTFTLKKTSGNTVYSDVHCTTVATSFKGTITGAGTAKVNTVYFNKAGEYQFTLTEDDLTEEQISDGVTAKDSTVYTITVTVAQATDGSYCVMGATYESSTGETGNLLNGDVPSFNNLLELSATTLTLKATKRVDGRVASDSTGGTFQFEVLESGEVVSTGSVGADGGEITFEPISYTIEDIGTHNLVIREVVPDDDDLVGGISYTAKNAFATVEVSAGSNASVSLSVVYKASNKNLLDSDGYPIFVNEYSAAGTFTLTGTKSLLQQGTENPVAIRAGEFNFVVTEDGTTVATGTTEAGGNIAFTEISYDLSDIGTHTYVVSEKDEGEMFIDYSDETFTVIVEVADHGDGTLSAEVTSVNGDTQLKTVSFTNAYTLDASTGVHMDFLPYVVVAVLAVGGLGTAVVMRRRKHRRDQA